MVYAKSVIIPLVFIYYFITNNYKISTSKAFIFLFCFWFVWRCQEYSYFRADGFEYALSSFFVNFAMKCSLSAKRRARLGYCTAIYWSIHGLNFLTRLSFAIGMEILVCSADLHRAEWTTLSAVSDPW